MSVEPSNVGVFAQADTKPKKGRPVGATEQWLRARKLHLGHFAFARAVVQGLSPSDSYRRFLSLEAEEGGARSAVTMVRWLREEFAAAAKKQDRPGTARLLSMDLSKIPAPEKKLPDMEEWVIEHGYDGFSESVQLMAYQEAHQEHAGEKLNKRTRLIERQLAALRWLETVVVQRPAPGDACGAWFADRVRRELGEAGVFTLAQLVERINGLGRNWYRSIRGVGPTKAKRLEDWLREHGTDLGLSLGAHVALPVSKLYPEERNRLVLPATAIRPLEKFVLPAELDGRAGRFRQPQAQCLLEARNDYEAILAWLKSKRPLSPEAQLNKRARQRAEHPADPEAPLAWLQVLSHTQRACRKEAERFLLWCILERKIPLSSMAVEDCLAYREFLAAPPADWCAPRGRERWSPLWRPFEGQLSSSAQHYAIVQLKNLYTFLVNQNYLMGNPWSGITMPRRTAVGPDASRSFTKRQWALIGEYLNKPTKESDGADNAGDGEGAVNVAVDSKRSEDRDTEKHVRLIFALTLLYGTGLRLSEAVRAKVKDLRFVEYRRDKGQEDGPKGWELTVIGKGEKVREVVVPQMVMNLFKRYLLKRGLPDNLDDASLQDCYLLAPLSIRDERKHKLPVVFENGQTAGLAENTLYSILKMFFQECGNELMKTKPKEGRHLLKASTHWLRHTHASHHVANGLPLEIVQQLLGHASLSTTTVYVTTEKARRMQAVQEIWE